MHVGKCIVLQRECHWQRCRCTPDNIGWRCWCQRIWSDTGSNTWNMLRCAARSRLLSDLKCASSANSSTRKLFDFGTLNFAHVASFGSLFQLWLRLIVVEFENTCFQVGQILERCRLLFLEFKCRYLKVATVLTFACMYCNIREYIEYCIYLL